jgi:hypothetical protein
VPEQSLAKFDIDAIGRVGESAETEGLGVIAFAAETAGDQCPFVLSRFPGAIAAFLDKVTKAHALVAPI